MFNKRYSTVVECGSSGSGKISIWGTIGIWGTFKKQLSSICNFLIKLTSKL